MDRKRERPEIPQEICSAVGKSGKFTKFGYNGWEGQALWRLKGVIHDRESRNVDPQARFGSI